MFHFLVGFHHCGEYGEKENRPHYHACLYNIDFEDKQLWQIRNGVRLYTSEILQKLWPHGFSTIGDVTYQSAAYVARYIMKKQKGKNARDAYIVFNRETGEIKQDKNGFVYRKPEYTTMSRNPGIGKEWFEKYKTDCYPSDFVIVEGKKVKNPKYYDSLYELSGGDIEKVKKQRKRKLQKRKNDLTPERLRVREEVLNF